MKGCQALYLTALRDLLCEEVMHNCRGLHFCRIILRIKIALVALYQIFVNRLIYAGDGVAVGCVTIYKAHKGLLQVLQASQQPCPLFLIILFSDDICIHVNGFH